MHDDDTNEMIAETQETEPHDSAEQTVSDPNSGSSTIVEPEDTTTAKTPIGQANVINIGVLVRG